MVCIQIPVPNLGIPAKFNPIVQVQGLAASNPGITGLKNCIKLFKEIN